MLSRSLVIVALTSVLYLHCKSQDVTFAASTSTASQINQQQLAASNFSTEEVDKSFFNSDSFAEFVQQIADNLPFGLGQSEQQQQGESGGSSSSLSSSSSSSGQEFGVLQTEAQNQAEIVGSESFAVEDHSANQLAGVVQGYESSNFDAGYTVTTTEGLLEERSLTRSGQGNSIVNTEYFNNILQQVVDTFSSYQESWGVNLSPQRCEALAKQVLVSVLSSEEFYRLIRNQWQHSGFFQQGSLGDISEEEITQITENLVTSVVTSASFGSIIQKELDLIIANEQWFESNYDSNVKIKQITNQLVASVQFYAKQVEQVFQRVINKQQADVSLFFQRLHQVSKQIVTAVISSQTFSSLLREEIRKKQKPKNTIVVSSELAVQEIHDFIETILNGQSFLALVQEQWQQVSYQSSGFTIKLSAQQIDQVTQSIATSNSFASLVQQEWRKIAYLQESSVTVEQYYQLKQQLISRVVTSQSFAYLIRQELSKFVEQATNVSTQLTSQQTHKIMTSIVSSQYYSQLVQQQYQTNFQSSVQLTSQQLLKVKRSVLASYSFYNFVQQEWKKATYSYGSSVTTEQYTQIKQQVVQSVLHSQFFASLIQQELNKVVVVNPQEPSVSTQLTSQQIQQIITSITSSGYFPVLVQTQWQKITSIQTSGFSSQLSAEQIERVIKALRSNDNFFTLIRQEWKQLTYLQNSLNGQQYSQLTQQLVSTILNSQSFTNIVQSELIQLVSFIKCNGRDFVEGRPLLENIRLQECLVTENNLLTRKLVENRIVRQSGPDQGETAETADDEEEAK